MEKEGVSEDDAENERSSSERRDTRPAAEIARLDANANIPEHQLPGLVTADYKVYRSTRKFVQVVKCGLHPTLSFMLHVGL